MRECSTATSASQGPGVTMVLVPMNSAYPLREQLPSFHPSGHLLCLRQPGAGCHLGRFPLTSDPGPCTGQTGTNRERDTTPVNKQGASVPGSPWAPQAGGSPPSRPVSYMLTQRP